jgi:hypothetical protein
VEALADLEVVRRRNLEVLIDKHGSQKNEELRVYNELEE